MVAAGIWVSPDSDLVRQPDFAGGGLEGGAWWVRFHGDGTFVLHERNVIIDTNLVHVFTGTTGGRALCGRWERESDSTWTVGDMQVAYDDLPRSMPDVDRWRLMPDGTLRSRVRGRDRVFRRDVMIDSQSVEQIESIPEGCR